MTSDEAQQALLDSGREYMYMDETAREGNTYEVHLYKDCDGARNVYSPPMLFESGEDCIQDAAIQTW